MLSFIGTATGPHPMATINGDSNNNNLNGSSGDDTINAEGGDDQVHANGGNDDIDGGSGNDNLLGGTGNDTIVGGGGNDTLDGGDGNDTLIDDNGSSTMFGGTGNDEMYANGSGSSMDGGAGDDYVVGSSGNDNQHGGDDNDTIFGNGGADSINAGKGDDEVYGGDGDDTIRGDEGNDTIDGGGGNDTITAEKGNDVVDGDAGNDTIYGGEGDDNLKGGDGNDLVQADSGIDTLEGGEGDDTLRGGTGTDTFVFRDGHGSDTIQWFTASEDIVAFDMAEISSYEDVLDRMSGSGNNTLITLDNGDFLTIADVQPDWLSASNFAYSAGPVCLLEGTPIFTQRGDVAIEELRPDDILWTKDNGWQALRLVVMETIHFRHRDDPGKPILVPAGALGANQPVHPIIASPQHRFLQVMADTGEEVLVPAVKLIGLNGIRRMRGRKMARYFNVVMERHSIIQAAGCWVESMLVTSRSMSRQHRSARKLLDAAMGMEPARRIEREGVRTRRLKVA